MDLRTAFVRARRSFRNDLALHTSASVALVIAFLCLGAVLLVLTNLTRLAEHWGSSRQATVYLHDEASESDIAQLRMVLESLGEVTQVTHVTAAEAKARFTEQADMGGDLTSLPPDVFPASLEIELSAAATEQRLEAIAARVTRFSAVEDVETYSDWFEQLGGVVGASRAVAIALSLLVMVCVIAVVGNTIRLAISRRTREIEVLKLCGATNVFVRRPFLIEGALQGLFSASCAMLLLAIAYVTLTLQLASTLIRVTGVELSFVSPLVVAALLVGGAALGAAGSALSLRGYLTV